MCMKIRRQLCGVSSLHPSLFGLPESSSGLRQGPLPNKPSPALSYSSMRFWGCCPSIPLYAHLSCNRLPISWQCTLYLGIGYKWLHSKLSHSFYGTRTREQLSWVILAQPYEVAAKTLLGIQSSEDWLGLRIHFFPEHIGFSIGLLECLLDMTAFPRTSDSRHVLLCSSC